ncbi:phage tail assembly protein [uncultured Hyphomicrobium sp.]|uniref:phage tail assembly protein n=1 Tax=uncultured Hyphomicrobium sp. TaxID=194373 RepID=UPI0025D286B5|nr:phage tail assembly protein [uncultured Hyphomicrobium sp.]
MLVPKVKDTAAQAAAPHVDPRRLPLSKSIQSHGGTINALTLRDPTAADYIEIGKLPFNVRGDSADRRVEVDFKLMALWAARLTGHDEIVIGQLSATDWLALTGRINTTLIQAGLTDVGNFDASAES